MNKKQALRLLKEMTDHFQDPKVTKACDLLIQKVSELSDQVIDQKEFPLPKQLQAKNDFALYTDGACRGNPGPGSWSCFATDHQGKMLFEYSAFQDLTTNNQMELIAAIEGFKELKEIGSGAMNIYLFSDSQYVCKGITEWLASWKRRGWKKSDGKAPDHLALWQQLDQILQEQVFQKVECHWVRGHAGHPQNEYCDRLCNEILDREQTL